MKVHYNYLPQEFAETSAIFDEWRILIESSDFTLGFYVEEFEKEFAKFAGVKHCVATNNGTDALILALKSIGVGTNDEVITVTNSFYATAGAIVAVGAIPVLVDCDDRFQICPKAIQSAITKKTKAILPVHWGGASPAIETILELASTYNLEIIEDACMGIGGSVGGKHPGSFGRVSAFSMHPLKSLNVMGDGGMVVTNDSDLNDWMRKYRNHGMKNRDTIEFWGVNMRLQPLQAIVAKQRLQVLDETISKRNRNAKYLDENLSKLSKYVQLPNRIDTNVETFALYMGLFENRDRLKNFLKENNVEVKIHYPKPLHIQPAAQKSCIMGEKLTNSEYQAERLLTLPVHQYLDIQHMKYVCETIFAFYGYEDG